MTHRSTASHGQAVASKRAFILKAVTRTVRGLTREDLYAAQEEDIGAPEGDLDRAILSLIDDGSLSAHGGRLQAGVREWRPAG